MLRHRKILSREGVKSYHVQRFCKFDYWLKNIHFVIRETEFDNLVNKNFKNRLRRYSLTVLLEFERKTGRQAN